MLIYNYDKITHEYLSSRTVDSDPEATRLQGKFVPLIPANATLIPPPQYNSQRQIPVFKNGEWSVKQDYRKNFYKVDDNLTVDDIRTIGEQEGFYIVDKAVGDLIKQNPDKYKIKDNQVIAKTNEEYQAELARREAEMQIQQIKTTLCELDLHAIRPLRAILSGTQTEEDLEKIKEIETKAKELRIKIQPLKSL